MANGHTVPLSGDFSRRRAHQLIERAPKGYIMSLNEPRRTLAQSDRMWAMLTDVSVQMPHGRRHTPADWKAIFMNACGWECQFLEGLDGRPFPEGFRSSHLTKTQMTSLIDFMFAWGGENGVVWSDPTIKDQAA